MNKGGKGVPWTSNEMFKLNSEHRSGIWDGLDTKAYSDYGSASRMSSNGNNHLDSASNIIDTNEEEFYSMFTSKQGDIKLHGVMKHEDGMLCNTSLKRLKLCDVQTDVKLHTFVINHHAFEAGLGVICRKDWTSDSDELYCSRFRKYTDAKAREDKLSKLEPKIDDDLNGCNTNAEMSCIPIETELKQVSEIGLRGNRKLESRHGWSIIIACSGKDHRKTTHWRHFGKNISPIQFLFHEQDIFWRTFLNISPIWFFFLIAEIISLFRARIKSGTYSSP